MLILTNTNFKSSMGSVVWPPIAQLQEDNDFL